MTVLFSSSSISLWFIKSEYTELSFKRIFVAVDIPFSVKRKFEFLKTEYNHDAIRWIPAQNMHITVHFMGKTGIESLASIYRILENITLKTRPFELFANSLKILTKRKKEIMVWADFQPNESFKLVSDQLRNNLPGDSEREQAPHITLARINPKKDIPSLAPLPTIDPFTISVNQMELWESIVGDSHPVYKCLKTFTFNNGNQ